MEEGEEIRSRVGCQRSGNSARRGQMSMWEALLEGRRRECKRKEEVEAGGLSKVGK